jgi:hypothetical protein
VFEVWLNDCVIITVDVRVERVNIEIDFVSPGMEIIATSLGSRENIGNN